MKQLIGKRWYIWPCVALVLALAGGGRSASAQITGCCIGPVCANKTAKSCQQSGGAPLDSTCTSSQDPRCTTCGGLSGAAFGLCNAYCERLSCPIDHNGQACDSLRNNWERLTGSRLFPCERPVCCQCAQGAMCSTLKKCLVAGCQVIDDCINGECPEPECCECRGPACRQLIPGACKLLGCIPKGDTVCTAAGRCEECPCGADCKDAVGNEGRCEQISGTTTCECKVPPPCGLNAAEECAGECPNAGEVCQETANGCGCVRPPPPDCTDPTVSCQGTCQVAGVVGTCQDINDVCECVTPVPDPCANAVPCGGTCQVAGAVGICQVTPNGCKCGPPPPSDPCANAVPCGGTCQVAGAVGICQVTTPNGCQCVVN